MQGLPAADVGRQVGHDDTARARFVERWLEATVPFSWTLHVAEASLKTRLQERCAAFTACLGAAAADGGQLAPGAPEMREPLQHLTFISGWLAGEGQPISSVLALCYGLQDALGVSSPEFFRALVIAASEAFAIGVARHVEGHHQRVMEKSQVVAMLRPNVVGLFLVGDPERQAMDDAVGRLMMMALMREPKCLVLDVSGLLDPEERLEDALNLLAAHQLAHTLPVLVSGVPTQMMSTLSHPKLDLASFEHLEHALGAENAKE